MAVVAKVARLLAPRQIVFEEQPLDPGRLAAGEVFAETLCSAISVGTEMAAYLGEPPLRPGPAYPRLVGYCNVAEIRAAGAGGAYAVGQRVLTTQSHRSAFVCRGDEILAPLPPGADAHHAATTYLFHLAHEALRTGGCAPQQRVAVIGLGTLGIATVALAASLGASVDAYSNRAPARQLARELGAAGAHARAEGANGASADLVVTTSNRWDDWHLALALARDGAAISVLGFPGRGQPAPGFNPLDSRYFYDRQLRVLACGKAPREARRESCAFLLAQIASGRLPAGRLIDGVSPWQELGAVYEELSRRQERQMTRILQWRGA